MRTNLKIFLLGLSILFFCPSTVLADDVVTVLIQEPWRDVFAGQTAVFHLTGTAPGTLGTAVIWRLSHNHRTLAQGTVNLGNRAPGAAPAELKLSVPPLQEGVIIPADLVLQSADGASPLLAEKIYIFPTDPFPLQKQWLTDLKIGLYDPDKTTRHAFEQIGLPFQPFTNIDALPSYDGKLFIVGQDADLNQNPELWNSLLALARRNIPVLLLAPQKGRLRLNDIAGPSASGAPDRLVLSRENIIRTLDKTLDTSWPPAGRTAITGFKISSENNDLYALVDPAPESWPWVEITLRNGGKIIICGFDVAGTAEQSPAPRYFLARLIDYLVNTHPKEELK